MKKRIILLVLLPVLFIFSVFIFKSINMKVWNVSLEEKQTEHYAVNLTSFIYNGEKYYELEELRKIGVYNDTFELENDYIYPYYFVEDMKSEVNYVTYDKSFFSILCADRIFEYQNDLERSILFVENNNVSGPSEGWYYVKDEFEFPNLNNDIVSSIFITTDMDTPNESNIIEINADVYAEIISEIKEHGDFKEFLPQREWSALYIKYSNSPLAERIARNDEGIIVWQEGGTP